MLPAIVCAGLTLLGIVVTALMWSRARWRTVVWWLGVSLLPLALYLLGLVSLLIAGWNTLVGWYQGLSLTPAAMVGAGLAALGVLLMIVSRFLPNRPRTKKKVAPADATPQLTRQRPVYDTTRTSAGGSSATAASSDDLEVTEILKRRGID